MKYLKLFENWLNEADGGVKPFDPNKYWLSRIVDISTDNYAKSPENKRKGVIESILRKAYNKTEDLDDPKNELSITEPFIIEFSGGSKQELKNKDIKKADAKLLLKRGDKQFRIMAELDSGENLEIFEKLSDKACFLMFLGEDYFDKPSGDSRYKYNEGYMSRNNGRFLLCPIKWSEPTDFILNSKWLVYHHVDSSKNTEKRVYETTLGCLVAFASSEFKNFALLTDENAGKPQNIAKTMGYEIPDNYAPGQGVEKKKA